MTLRAQVDEWLTSRAEGIPPSLWHAIRGAITDEVVGESSSPSDVFRRAAERLLVESLTPPQDAMTVLAADALITYACEATADEDPEGLARLG